MSSSKHPLHENLIAILTGTFIVAQGIFFLQQSQLLTGGTTGLALLLAHFVDISFGKLYFLMNCPFYLMAWFRMGRSFAITSILSGALVSLMVDNMHYVLTISWLNPVYCAVIGGLLMGLGMLILFRHHTSLGGFNVLVLFIQDKFGISAGKIQMSIDISILVASFFFVSPTILLLSILGAVMLNLVLAMNYKPGRYNPVMPDVN
ncbi:YitT family protein [Photobacterium lucens]|uniref:YitT family protein n=1 Tax=Photobacterium lucens TaxID=2562949 RepID=UPI00136E8169|nr:YitT family protein [Photobacterium lucens]MBP2699055.1 YitT family protein [Vibrio parahaemolyticus]MZG58543.1 YitT family protein [Photobacterium lucens]MZG82711.1 YitT family protein [Photobacterium lucens]